MPQDYPIRLDISKPGQVRRVPEAKPRTAGQAGAAVNRGVRKAASAATNNVLAAFPVLGPLLGPAATALGDKQTRVAARDFVEAAATGRAEKPKRVAASGKGIGSFLTEGPVALAQAAARYAGDVDKVSISPEDRAAALASTILSGPTSLREAQMATGLIPARGQAPSGKDVAIAEYNKFADSLFQQQTDRLAKAAAQAQSEEERAEIQKQYESAYAAHLRTRGAVFQGALPINVPVGNQIAGGDF